VRRFAATFIVRVLDPLILWIFGWRKVRVHPSITTQGPHYIDPINPTNLWLRDQAIRICEARIRASVKR
jgi:hypothetical protein